ncbi:thermonuclease family protein [Hirschia litorea]|uniref:Thermonuclease family protein n=1 Tax=Hirschia litorea TaxID=1199156 RepID=A0ABW2IJB5_9PROT
MKSILQIASIFALFISPAIAQTQTLQNDKLIVKAGSESTIEIVDGDTLWVGNHEIRLYGIDAPEATQSCIVEGLSRNYCHTQASKYLENLAANTEFECEFKDKDGKPWIRYGRYIADCRVGSLDVSKELVRNGWAYADPNYGDAYATDQEYAQKNKLGIHATEHKAPWVWRKEKRGDSCSCK